VQVGLHPLTRFLRYILYATPIGLLLAGPTVGDMKRLRATSKKFFEERQKMETLDGGADFSIENPRKDFYYYIFRGTDTETGSKYTQAELASESNLLLVAGSDTTATTLSAVFFYLLRNPNILEKLRSEIEDSFSNVDEINHAKLTGLPYLRAVIDETMRLAPPVAGALPRDVLEGGIHVDGIFIPEGTEVGVPIYAIHHNKEYYPDPFDFKPERWIVNEKQGVRKADVERAQSAFTPFSIGHRGCIGKNLAYVELSLAVARLVMRYDFQEVEGWGRCTKGGGWKERMIASPPENGAARPKQQLLDGPWGREGEYVVKDGFVANKDGPVVRFRERSY
jgi:cytochrome P450